MCDINMLSNPFAKTLQGQMLQELLVCIINVPTDIMGNNMYWDTQAPRQS